MTEIPANLQPIADFFAEHWGKLGSLVAVLIGNRVLVKKTGKSVFTYLKNFVLAPTVVMTLSEQLTFPDGQTLKTRLDGIAGTQEHFRQMLANDTANRRYTLQAKDEAFFEFDRQGEFRWANSAFTRLVSLPLERLEDRNWQNIIALPDRQRTLAGFKSAREDASDYRVKFRLMQASEEEWVLFDAQCNRDEAGKVLGYIGKLMPAPNPNVHSTGEHTQRGDL